MAFPLTAVLVPNSRLSDPNVDIKEARECTLMLYDPVRDQFVGDKDNKIALEIDLTTPLAYMWSHTDLDRYRADRPLRPSTLWKCGQLASAEAVRARQDPGR